MISSALRQISALCAQGEIEQAFGVVAGALAQSPGEPSVEGLASALTPTAIATLGLEPLKPAIVAWAHFALGVPVGASARDPRLVNIHWAAELIARVRHVFPDEPQIYVAESLVRRRDPDRHTALEVARDGERRFPGVWSCRTALQHALADAGKLDEALLAARRALVLDPSEGSPLHDIAWAFLNAGRNLEAEALFQQLRGRFPNYPLAQP